MLLWTPADNSALPALAVLVKSSDPTAGIAVDRKNNEAMKEIRRPVDEAYVHIDR